MRMPVWRSTSIDRPAPEHAVFFEAEVAAGAVEGVGPHHAGSAEAAVGGVSGRDDPHEGFAVDGERVAVGGGSAGGE